MMKSQKKIYEITMPDGTVHIVHGSTEVTKRFGISPAILSRMVTLGTSYPAWWETNKGTAYQNYSSERKQQLKRLVGATARVLNFDEEGNKR